MTNWKDIIKTATVGTNRLDFKTEGSADWETPFTKEKKESKAENLLQMASVLSLRKRAGIKAKNNETALPEPAESESQKYLSNEAIYYFKNIDSSDLFLLKEFIDEVIVNDCLLPPQLLPQLFNVAKHTYIHKVLQIAGKRGQWLAQQNPNWKQFIETESEDWETGEFEQRLRFFSSMRQKNPEQSATFLEAIIADESVRNLQKLLNEMHEGLNPNDEPLLEPLLKHKRKEIRTLSAQLLSKLPNAALGERMKERLNEHFSFNKSKIVLKLPKDLTKEMAEDGMTDSVPIKRMGKRSYFLVQMLSVVPSTYWSEQQKETPEKLLKIASKNDFFHAIAIGWARATVNHPNSEWAEALTKVFINDIKLYEKLDQEIIRSILQMMDKKTFNKLVQDKLKTEKKALKANSMSLRLIMNYDQELAPKTAKDFFNCIQTTITNLNQKKHNYSFESLIYRLKGLAHIFPIESIPDMIKSWSDLDSDKWYSKHISSLFHNLEFRMKMLNAIRNS